MDLIADTRIPFTRELAFTTIRDRLQALVPHMPNVKSIETLERRDDGAKTHFVNRWTANTEIPAAARSYVKAEMLQWIDRATWDAEAGTCDWKIETVALPGVVECSGRNTYRTVGNETELVIRGSLVLHLDKANIPRLVAMAVRPIIEGIVVGSLKPNLTSIGGGVTAYLRAEAQRGA
jgi:hypothetical protein